MWAKLDKVRQVSVYEDVHNIALSADFKGGRDFSDELCFSV